MDIVAGAVGSIVTKLGELLHGEYKLQKGLQVQIEYLKNELESAHTALCKVGEMPPEHLDPQVRLWAGDVREASYDMEDILDTFLINVMDGAAPAENKSKKGLLKRLKKMAKLLRNSMARHNIAGAIEDMKKRLQEVWNRRDRYSIPIAVAAPATKLDPRLVDMHNEAAQIIGIERTRAELIAMLKPSIHGHGDGSASSSSNPSKIVSVVGAGGLGKTTLAKAVYDELSTGYDCRAFVSVGRNPDLVQVFTNIFFQVDKEEYKAICDTKDPQLLIGELRKSLGNKRYFIVIDDVWDMNSWQALGSVLHENNNGSRVVKTTRNLEVACGDEVYKLGPLSHGNSKKLFYIRLYGGEGKCPAHHPEEASQKILDKCGGVPLAIITMASLLVGKSREDWVRVCSSPGFYRDRENKQVDDTVWILSLSYYDLPSHLKTCLLYLSAYPEDYEIEKDSLIWKWVAEGFIQEKIGTSLFQRGEEYFHQLINRSMIQGVESVDDDIIVGCRVHDMVLDLICGLAGEENFITVSNEDGGTSSRHKVRRLAQQNRILLLDQSHPDSHRDTEQLRTLVAIQCNMRDWVLSPSFKLLRVLALVRCKSPDNSECGRNCLEYLGKLVHLRYLMIRGTKVRELPEAIGALKLLQTLDLGDGVGDTPMQLPSSISLLTRLVCLKCQVQTRVPDGFFQKVRSLEQLQISLLWLSFESKRQFLKQLGNLRLLRMLRVLGMGILDESMQVELLKSLGNLQELQHLQLYGHEINDDALEWDNAMLSEHVSYLDLGSFGFPCVPSFVNPTLLPNLFHLTLCVDHLDETAMRVLGGMPHLLYLYIFPTGGMVSHEQSMVINIAASCDVLFPKLRSLSLRGWMVQLVTNDDSSIASLSIWAGGHDATAAAVMPNLRKLVFTVYVRAFYKDGQSICDNLGFDKYMLQGLKCLPSLQCVEAYIDRAGALPHDVNKVKAELRRLAQLHPNTSLRLDVYDMYIDEDDEDDMTEEEVSAAKSQSGREEENEMLKRQKCRATSLSERISHQKKLHNSMKREAVNIGELITKSNLSDDTKNMVQEFHEQFTATVHRVQQKLLPMEDGTPIQDHDLTRVLEHIKAMEQALEILTVKYQRFAAILEKLRYSLSLQEVMPMPQILNLNIHVFDIRVDKLGLDFGLLGKISSLRVIKALVICQFCFLTEVEEVEAELREAVNIHHPNNPPTLEIIRYAEDRMVNSDSDPQMLERQIWRGRRLFGRIEHQKELHNILQSQVVKMVEQKTRMNLSDDVKHKEQRFHKHFHATFVSVRQELLRVNENIPNRDLRRMTEEITDMERALHILTVQYPRLVAMHEELKTALSIKAEDEDEITEEVEVSEAAFYDTEEEDEVPAALLSDIEHEHDVNVEEEVSAGPVSDRNEEYKVTEEVVSAASVSKTQGEEPIHL